MFDGMESLVAVFPSFSFLSHCGNYITYHICFQPSGFWGFLIDFVLCDLLSSKKSYFNIENLGGFVQLMDAHHYKRK